ncbi:hypothetical protein OROHE_021645 [Orobanche hederae]
MAQPMAAIVLLLSAALILSVSTASDLQKPPAPPPENPNSMEECVILLFGSRAEATASFGKRIFCRNLLRITARSFQITGKLTPDYLTALKELPTFKNNPARLKIFLCGLRPAKKAAEKFGCNKIVAEPDRMK